MTFSLPQAIRAVLVAVLAPAGCTPSLPDDLPGLMHAMASNDMRVNFAAARRVREAYGKEGLLEALKQEDANTRGVAAHFLMNDRGADVQTALLRATTDSDEYVRMWAAFALGKNGDAEALMRLEALEADPSDKVMRMARRAREELVGRLADQTSAQ